MKIFLAMALMLLEALVDVFRVVMRDEHTRSKVHDVSKHE